MLAQLLAWLALHLPLLLEGDTEIKAVSSKGASRSEPRGRASIPTSEAKQVALPQTWMLLGSAGAGEKASDSSFQRGTC